MKSHDTRPGHLARRFQQIAVGVFQAEVEALGYDLTPVQYVALLSIDRQPGVDQATLAGLIAYDRTTIGGVVERLVRKGLVHRGPSKTDRRAHALESTPLGKETLAGIQPGVDSAQQIMLSGLTKEEGVAFMRLLHKAVDALSDRSRAPLRYEPADGA